MFKNFFFLKFPVQNIMRKFCSRRPVRFTVVLVPAESRSHPASLVRLGISIQRKWQEVSMRIDKSSAQTSLVFS